MPGKPKDWAGESVTPKNLWEVRPAKQADEDIALTEMRVGEPDTDEQERSDDESRVSELVS